jgi:tRNA threonylcarbamoyladenosine biosynthesis protein TsaB
MLLALDTATTTMSIALHDGQSLLAEQTWPSDNQHTVELAPALEKLLAYCGQTVANLTALACATGPGSYTGLRIGVAFAKGLASARKLPLIGVSTLDILAAAQPNYQNTLIVVVTAGRGRVAVARYQWRKGKWVSRGEPQLMNWATLFASVDGPAHLTGEVSAEGYEKWKTAQANGIPVSLVSAGHRLRRAGFLAEEAWARYQAADQTGFDAAQVTPFYIKTQDVPQN